MFNENQFNNKNKIKILVSKISICIKIIISIKKNIKINIKINNKIIFK